MSRHASGFKAWLVQRITAVMLAVFTLYAFFYLVWFTPQSFMQWQSWVLSTPVLLGFLLLVLFTLVHAWVGIRDVLIDYVSHTGVRLVLLSLVGVMIAACGLWALLILISARIG